MMEKLQIVLLPMMVVLLIPVVQKHVQIVSLTFLHMVLNVVIVLQLSLV